MPKERGKGTPFVTRGGEGAKRTKRGRKEELLYFNFGDLCKVLTAVG